MNNSIFKLSLFLLIFIGLFSTQVVLAEDFTTRCNASGVILCSGFDVSETDIDPFMYGDDGGTIFPSLETTDKASGAGSVKFVIPALSSDNSSGGLDRIMNESTSGFTSGDTFYIQFRQKFSSEMFNPVMLGEGWKQVIITSTYGFYGDPLVIGLRNDAWGNQPKLYIGTGSAIAQSPDDGTPVTYVNDQWMTFYFKITVGTWGEANSQIEVWAADETHALERIYNLTNITLSQNADLEGINKISFGPNNTGKDITIDHTPASTWYDELIVSTSPIADSYTVITPPADTTAPTAPGSFTATAVSTSQINLTWASSTDVVGVTGYKIYRDGNLINTSNSLSYQNTGLNSSTTYNYEITAFDLAGNISATSTVSATTQTPPDITAPTIPTSLTATAVSTSQINLTWASSTDAIGVTGYKIYRDGNQIATSTLLSYSNTGLTANTSYNFYVSAFDNANNVSATSTSVSATTQTEPVVTPPSSGGGGGGGGGGVFYPAPATTFTASPSSIRPGGSVQLSWTSTNATSLSIDQGIGNVSLSGSRVVSPSTTTVYTLTSVGSGGTGTNKIIVTVSSSAPTQTASALLGLLQASTGNTSTTSTSISSIFQIGSRITVNKNVNVRQTSGITGIKLTVQIIGKKGSIIEGPIIKDGYTWWKVNYDDGLIGWSAENYLTLVVSTIPTSTQTTGSFNRNLYFGMRNDLDVTRLQTILQREGLLSVAPTGNFFALTQTAVKKFQTKYGISSTGYVGPITRAKLNSL